MSSHKSSMYPSTEIIKPLTRQFVILLNGESKDKTAAKCSIKHRNDSFLRHFKWLVVHPTPDESRARERAMMITAF